MIDQFCDRQRNEFDDVDTSKNVATHIRHLVGFAGVKTLMKLVIVLLRYTQARRDRRDDRFDVGSDVSAAVVASFAMHSLRLIAHIAQITQMLSITWHRRRLGRRRRQQRRRRRWRRRPGQILSQLIESQVRLTANQPASQRCFLFHFLFFCSCFFSLIC